MPPVRAPGTVGFLRMGSGAFWRTADVSGRWHQDGPWEFCLGMNKAAVVLIAGFAASAVVGAVFLERHNRREENTARFDRCMKDAPYRKRFEVFRQTFDDPMPVEPTTEEHIELRRQLTAADDGMPPIWDGRLLVPWYRFHSESIRIAERCHHILGVKAPQKELSYPYNGDAWDPRGTYWRRHGFRPRY